MQWKKSYLAEENYNLALKIYEYLAINDKSQNYGIFICLNNLANVSKSNSKEKYQKAKTYLTDNEKNNPNDANVNLCDMNIALCLYDEGKLEEALTELVKLKNKFNEAKHPNEISLVFYQMGSIYLSKKDYKNARDLLTKSKNIREALYDKIPHIDKADTYKKLALVDLEEGKEILDHLLKIMVQNYLELEKK